MCTQIHSPGHSIGSGALLHLGLAWPAAVCLFDGAVWFFGWASSMRVSQCLFSPSWGHLGKLVAKGASGHWASVCSVASPTKHAKSAGSGSVSPRSSVRSKQTCFFAGPWGKHSVTDPGGEWGDPAVCEYCQALSCWPVSSWIPTAGAVDEFCSKSGTISHPCSVGAVDSDSEVHLLGLVEAWGHASLAFWCSGDGLCCCTLLLCPLLLGHELLKRESPLGHLATSFLLPSAEDDLAWDGEWTCKSPLP